MAVDSGVDKRIISEIKLSVMEKKEEGGETQWYIKVQEKAKTSKATEYSIKRRYSEIVWLIKVRHRVFSL